MSTYSVLRRIIVVACACIVALTIFCGAAYANEDAATVPLTIDCSQVPDTPATRAALAQYNLCGYGSAEGGATGQGSVYGNCGTLTLELEDSLDGSVSWHVNITSILGPMSSASFLGFVENMDFSTSYPMSGSFSGTYRDYWDDYGLEPTGPGPVIGLITAASSTLVLGGICTNSGFPADETRVQ